MDCFNVPDSDYFNLVYNISVENIVTTEPPNTEEPRALPRFVKSCIEIGLADLAKKLIPHFISLHHLLVVATFRSA